MRWGLERERRGWLQKGRGLGREGQGLRRKLLLGGRVSALSPSNDRGGIKRQPNQSPHESPRLASPLSNRSAARSDRGKMAAHRGERGGSGPAAPPWSPVPCPGSSDRVFSPQSLGDVAPRRAQGRGLAAPLQCVNHPPSPKPAAPPKLPDPSPCRPRRSAAAPPLDAAPSSIRRHGHSEPNAPTGPTRAPSPQTGAHPGPPPDQGGGAEEPDPKAQEAELGEPPLRAGAAQHRPRGHRLRARRGPQPAGAPRCPGAGWAHSGPSRRQTHRGARKVRLRPRAGEEMTEDLRMGVLGMRPGWDEGPQSGTRWPWVLFRIKVGGDVGCGVD